MSAVIRVATDEGLWVLTETGDHLELEGLKVHALEADVSGHWALVDERQLRWQPRGGDWEHVATSEALALRCLLPSEDGVLVGAEEGHLLRPGRVGLEIVTSFEFAHGRDNWWTPWGGPPDVRSMTVAADGTTFVNVHVGGILRSADDGTSWLPTIEIDADVHEVLAIQHRPGWLLAATAVGLATSSDSGATWTFDRGGLASTYCRAVALCGETVLLSASDGPRGGRSALYRRELDAEGFGRCEAGLSEWFDDNIDTGCVAGSTAMAVFGTKDGRVFVSSDRGLSWEPARDVLACVHRVVIE
jgi:hypothetical protein